MEVPKFKTACCYLLELQQHNVMFRTRKTNNDKSASRKIWGIPNIFLNFPNIQTFRSQITPIQPA
ncbi:MAG: hypothetical protein DRP46_07010 [Candidatus Zixiibacteriota bacterium]|nr:MAG: hypothetical protein DRP46_07010 [candidate division Zixibacteria bacterium]